MKTKNEIMNGEIIYNNQRRAAVRRRENIARIKEKSNCGSMLQRDAMRPWQQRYQKLRLTSRIGEFAPRGAK